MIETSMPSRTRWQFQTAMILPMSADDDFQLFVMPFYTEGARYRAPMTYSILLWQRSWCAYLDGIGSFCLRSLLN